MRRVWLTLVVLILAAGGTRLAAQAGANGGEWPTYGGDLGNTRYSPLDQINAGELQQAARSPGASRPTTSARARNSISKATPLMVNGVLYSTAGTRRAVVALDAATGELLWMHSENEGKRGDSGAAPAFRPRPGLLDRRPQESASSTSRPAIGWSRSTPRPARPFPRFGKNGIVDLKLETTIRRSILITGEIGLHSTPIVAEERRDRRRGAPARRRRPRARHNVKGYVRGFDVRTGKRLWIFHTIPQPGEFGNDTWEKDSWSYTGNTGVWGTDLGR